MASQGRPDRAGLHRLLGNWEIGFGAPVLTAERRIGAALVRDLDFATSDGQVVPASFAVPAGTVTPAAAVLYCHAHGGRYEIGRAELTEGRPALLRPYLADLTGLGLAVLCLEMPCFGRRAVPGEQALAKALAWQGRTLFGRMLAELSAGIGWLAGQPGIDRGRIGVLGLSMGATQAFWLGALDPRLAAVAHLCCFADLGCLVASGRHDRHGPYMTVPGLLPYCATGALAGLAAPRPQLACVGLADPLTPPDCFARARADLEAAYAAAGAADRLAFLVEPEGGHRETPAMREAVLAFLARHLR